MVFEWLFGRNNKKIENRINLLDQTLQKSFSNIKKDISFVGNWIEKFNFENKEQDLKINDLQNRINFILKLLEQKTILSQEEKKEIPEIQIQTNILDTLTDTQKLIFLRLNTLQKEVEDNWITLKYLAQELYPDKSYNSIRSTLSEYTDILIDVGLVTKKRKGKQTLISLTEKGQKLLEQIKTNKKQKLLSKNKIIQA
ncbi:MAG: hypothetical protein AB1571_03855 [Nanoarchaeota archaeon]